MVVERRSVRLWLLNTRDRNVPFVALRFFDEGRDIGVLGVDARDQASQGATDLLADLQSFCFEHLIHPPLGRVLQTHSQLPVGVETTTLSASSRPLTSTSCSYSVRGGYVRLAYSISFVRVAASTAWSLLTKCNCQGVGIKQFGFI
jgi:hypothetical protein